MILFRPDCVSIVKDYCRNFLPNSSNGSFTFNNKFYPLSSFKPCTIMLLLRSSSTMACWTVVFNDFTATFSQLCCKTWFQIYLRLLNKICQFLSFAVQQLAPNSDWIALWLIILVSSSLFSSINSALLNWLVALVHKIAQGHNITAWSRKPRAELCLRVA